MFKSKADGHGWRKQTITIRNKGSTLIDYVTSAHLLLDYPPILFCLVLPYSRRTFTVLNPRCLYSTLSKSLFALFSPYLALFRQFTVLRVSLYGVCKSFLIYLIDSRSPFACRGSAKYRLSGCACVIVWTYLVDWLTISISQVS